MSEENTNITQNDIEEIRALFNDTFYKMSSNSNSAGLNIEQPDIVELLDKLSDKVPSLKNIVVPPIVKTFVKGTLEPFLKIGRELNDKYMARVEAMLDDGRYMKLPELLRLSALNQARLQYAKSTEFSNLRDYVAQKYHEDISDPDGTIGFIPSRSISTAAIWSVIRQLSNKGLVTVLEEEKELSNENATIKVAIIRMAENV